jgi:hypothetical protein
MERLEKDRSHISGHALCTTRAIFHDVDKYITYSLGRPRYTASVLTLTCFDPDGHFAATNYVTSAMLHEYARNVNDTTDCEMLRMLFVCI